MKVKWVSEKESPELHRMVADLGSVRLGNMPHHLASALYKLVYSNAFFLNDPSRSWYEIKELAQVDRDMSGTIDYDELMELRQKKVRLRTSDKMVEFLSSHPNTLKRVKHLSTLVV
jgi:heat shock protein HtpX